MVLRAVHREACKERSVFYGTRRLLYYVAASRSYSQQHPRTADRRFYLPRVSRITTRFSICKCDICARIMIQTSQGKNYIE
jgi:hypothetical protein